MSYDIYRYDKHMLVKIATITEDKFHEYGEKDRIIYSDYSETIEAGWVLVNEDQDITYYAMKV